MDFLVLMAACDDRATGRVKHGKGVPAFVEPRHRGAADLVRNPLACLVVERQPHRTMMIESPPPRSLEQVQDERREAALVAADLGACLVMFFIRMSLPGRWIWSGLYNIFAAHACLSLVRNYQIL